MIRHLVLVIIIGMCLTSVQAQNNVDFKVRNIEIGKSGKVFPAQMKPGFDPTLYNLEQPVPGGNSVQSYLLEQKIISRQKFPVKHAKMKSGAEKALNPLLGREFGLYRKLSNGLVLNIYGGRPNDNTLAVSNDGIVLVSMNSTLYGHDLDNDTAVLTSQFISLTSMASGFSSENYFDPKVIYDEVADRFILVFLKDNTSAKNQLIVCFSTTNHPNDPWNVYRLPGNPLDNDRWTDFPVIAHTAEDLFFTGNLIVPGQPWQTGFGGSIIWQIDKEKGYNGDSTLTTKLFSDIKFENNFIRNLHAVQGASGQAEEMYLLSNRNFDITNDSIFMLKVGGAAVDTLSTLDINVYSSDLPYGVPPNGRQQDTDTLDPASGLQTNDGRVLGAIKIGDQIQFVSNTVNPATGLSAIYHGVITPLEDNPVITATIIGDSIKDFGYPNVAWTGNEACDIETIIGFNYTSLTDFPGIGCVYYDNEGNYSDLIVTKEGEDYVDRSSTTSERWGDYFGLQRKFSEPGTVYSFGYFGTFGNSNTGWCTELFSPDTSQMYISVEHENQPSLCEQLIKVDVAGGIPPYSYSWSNFPDNTSSVSDPLCEGDSVVVSVTDARGCTVSKTVLTEMLPADNDVSVYPNPASDRLVVQFSLEQEAMVNAKIYDVEGKLVVDLIQRQMAAGLNELTFSTYPLSIGEYVLIVYDGQNKIITEKFIKK